MTYKLFEHQSRNKQAILNKHRFLLFSDPGTGKTLTVLSAIEDLRKAQGAGRALVFAPKAILEPSWRDDCQKFTPHLSIAIATAKNRERAFTMGTDIVVTNHDAATWVEEHPHLLKGFDILVIDESTAFKHRTSKRAAAMAKIKDRFKYRIAMTGTPTPNSLLDLWHQVFLVDDGDRLGGRYYAFRAITHEPKPHYVGFRQFTDWEEKSGAREVVADLISDITARDKLEECVDMPERIVTPLTYDMPAKVSSAYRAMVQDAIIVLQNTEVTAVSAAAVRTKLLQIASGAVYSGDECVSLDPTRYDLVAELVLEREHSIVAFQWKHQRDGLVKALERAGVDNFAIIDGTTKDTGQIVRDFQAGKYRTVLCQPQSASHGLTFTKANTTIWASPPATRDAERFEQFNHRIYRVGQTKRTETILVQARGTLDEREYELVQGKVDNQSDLLYLIQSLAEGDTNVADTWQ